jgi:hypothetical protein
MGSADDVWLCLLLVALFGLLLFLRIRFPRASKGTETAILVSATVVFFSVCSFLLKPRLAADSHNVPIAQAGNAVRR